MWLVTELAGSTDGTLENFSGMSPIALSHLHFLSQQKVACCSPNRGICWCLWTPTHMLFLSSGISTPSLLGRLLFIPRTQSRCHCSSEAFLIILLSFLPWDWVTFLLHCLCACVFLWLTHHTAYLLCPSQVSVGATVVWQIILHAAVQCQIPSSITDEASYTTSLSSMPHL